MGEAVKPFGEAFTKELHDGCVKLEVEPSWVLDVLAFESGLDPNVLQGHARLVPPTGPADMRPRVYGTKFVLSHGTGARGLFQKMPTVLTPLGMKPKTIRLYEGKGHAAQLRDAFKFWRDMCKMMRVTHLPTREHLYCLNLAPARLQDDKATPDTVLYSFPSEAYKQNRGLDVRNRGAIILSDLRFKLDDAHKRYEARINAELEALERYRSEPPPDVA